MSPQPTGGLHANAPAHAESRDPRTGALWASFPGASRDEVLEVVRRAREAQPRWASLALRERIERLAEVARLLYARRDDIARVISRENGKPTAEALSTEIATTLDIIRFYCRVAGGVLAPTRTGSASLALWRKRLIVERAPYGVVGVIAPWNYPFMLPAGIVVPALLAGNAVLLKPSELTPSSAEALARLLADAGVPAGAFQVVHGDGSTGRSLVEAALDKVFFTGSVATGRRVAVACAERLVPCTLELGGSDPALVLDDADIEHAVSGILWGRFSNAGQTCVAPKRVLVHSAVYERFTSQLAARVRALRLFESDDDVYDVGALIRPSQRTVLEAQVEDAVTRGGRLLEHGAEVVSSARQASSFMPPCLVFDAPSDARVLQEETFGPVLPVIRVDDVDEMVRLANATEFGLSASVWSRNRDRARAIARRIHAGSVVINDVTLVAGVAEVPHGGVKHSGSGRSHGIAGLEECVRTQTIIDDMFATRRQPWWFGYGMTSEARMQAYLRLAHGRTPWERLTGLWGTLALLFRPERPL